MAGVSRTTVVTFKVDEALRQALEGLPNRSEFIRSAIVAALDGACPLCKGTGILTAAQRNHWRDFARNHMLRRCSDCDAVHLVCAADEDQADRQNSNKGSPQ